MGFFTRKKKIGSYAEFKMVDSLKLPFIPFGDDVLKSDVVQICIDRVATQCAKLKGRHISKGNEDIKTEKNSNVDFLLKHRPNHLMTPYQFLYKIVTLLLLNDNVFIYPQYSKNDGRIESIYPINPRMVEPLEYSDGSLFLKFTFMNGTSYTIPYENIIHLKRFYTEDTIFGGNGYTKNHETLLKTLKINDSLLQGVESAMLSSFQIKGILKINAMLKDSDKQKQLDEFNTALASANKSSSSIIPMDTKSDYIELSLDPKFIDEPTLRFIQSKILDYYGVSVEIFENNYDETQFNAFYESTIEPIIIQLNEAFSLGLLTDNELHRGEEITFFSERLQYASWDTKVNAIEKLIGLGIMSINESRGLLGLEPFEGGSKRLQSLNFVDADIVNQYQVGGKKNEEE